MRFRNLLVAALMAILFVATRSSGAEGPGLDVRRLMTAEEFKRTGLSKLDEKELIAFNEWLLQFGKKPVQPGRGGTEASSGAKSSPQPRASSCPRGFTSSVEDELEELNGGSVIKLVDGSVWKQLDGYYEYSYTYSATVRVFPVEGGGCMMHIQGFDQPIAVRRLD